MDHLKSVRDQLVKRLQRSLARAEAALAVKEQIENLYVIGLNGAYVTPTLKDGFTTGQCRVFSNPADALLLSYSNAQRMAPLCFNGKGDRYQAVKIVDELPDFIETAKRTIETTTKETG